MTDRVRTLTVLLEQDVRTDDVECIVDAVRMIRGVQHVRLGPVVGIEAWTAREVARRELEAKLREALR